MASMPIPFHSISLDKLKGYGMDHRVKPGDDQRLAIG